MAKQLNRMKKGEKKQKFLTFARRRSLHSAKGREFNNCGATMEMSSKLIYSSVLYMDEEWFILVKIQLPNYYLDLQI